jgi:uridine kinase
MQRTQAILTVKNHILTIMDNHPLRVGLDGVDCAGKTSLADELAASLAAGGGHVIRASIDDFHNPRAVRYRQGRSSPRGYYEDSFDLEAVLNTLLLPLGPGGSRWYRTAVFDHKSDLPLETPKQIAPENCVLLFDGIFLHRPELLPHLDFTIFVMADFTVAIERAFQRDRPLFQTVDNVKKMYELRYIPGQELYFAECSPLKKANLLFQNNDLQNPTILSKKANRII